MGEREIFNQINELLSNSGYNTKVNGLADLADFLNQEKNTDNEVYDKIRELYDQFIMGVGMW